MSLSAKPSESEDHPRSLPREPNPQSASLFFRLPTEIRVQIYKLLCGNILFIPSSPEEYRHRPSYYNTQTSIDRQAGLWGLLGGCRILYRETLRYLMRENAFVFHNFIALAKFHEDFVKPVKFDGCIVPPPRHIMVQRLIKKAPNELFRGGIIQLLEGLEVLEICTEWLDDWFFWCCLMGGGGMLGELMQLRGVELRVNPRPPSLGVMRYALPSKIQAWREMIGQPKTGQGHLKLMEKEKNEALNKIIERSKEISASGSG